MSADPETYNPYTILSQRQCGLLRAVQLPTTVRLQAFTPQGLQEVELDSEELERFLRALPAETLQAALTAPASLQRLAAEVRVLETKFGSTYVVRGN